MIGNCSPVPSNKEYVHLRNPKLANLSVQHSTEDFWPALIGASFETSWRQFYELQLLGPSVEGVVLSNYL